MPTRTASFGYEYADLAAAVCKMLGMPTKAMPAVMARIKNFFRLGLIQDQKSRAGARIIFKESDAFDLCLATIMGYNGIGPADAIRIINESREQIHSLAKMGTAFAVKGEYATMHWEVGKLWRDFYDAAHHG